MGFLNGKRALIVGVASERSIAWGIAKVMHREGAELAFTYQNDKLKDRVKKIAGKLGTDIVLPCDVSHDEPIYGMCDKIGKVWDGLDILVHSVAFAPREELDGNYISSTTRKGFLAAHNISSYSFTALGKAARLLMAERNGAMLTLSYIGAQRAMPNYNVMGVAKASLESNVRYMAASLGADHIRVNGISAGPIKTLASSGVTGLKNFMRYAEQTSPLRRNVTLEEIGNAAAFLCSDLASAITGEITYVDCGYNIVGISHN